MIVIRVLNSDLAEALNAVSDLIKDDWQVREYSSTSEIYVTDGKVDTLYLRYYFQTYYPYIPVELTSTNYGTCYIPLQETGITRISQIPIDWEQQEDLSNKIKLFKTIGLPQQDWIL